jgi:hypothetical protein
MNRGRGERDVMGDDDAPNEESSNAGDDAW